MKAKFSVLGFAVFLFPIHSWAQNTAGTTQAFGNSIQSSGIEGKFRYYVSETYLNPSVFTAPAFRAGIRMANPPGKGAMQYPPEWRQGAEAFGRNYGDAFAQRVTFQTGRFATGVITHEDPRYIPSSSHNVLARSLHALTFTFLDRSDSGRPMPAFSNFGCHSRRIRWECISSFRLQQHHTCRSAGDSSVRVHRCGEPVSRVCAANAQTRTHGVPANCPVMTIRALRRRT